MLLTKNEGVRFKNQTVYISGQAFVNCTFTDCTLVLRETVHYLKDCTFDRCNWHVDCVLMWGAPESIVQLKALCDRMEQAQQQLQGQIEQDQAKQQAAPAAAVAPFAD